MVFINKTKGWLIKSGVLTSHSSILINCDFYGSIWSRLFGIFDTLSPVRYLAVHNNGRVEEVKNSCLVVHNEGLCKFVYTHSTLLERCNERVIVLCYGRTVHHTRIVGGLVLKVDLVVLVLKIKFDFESDIDGRRIATSLRTWMKISNRIL